MLSESAFWSNCILEALKAKCRNWRGVKLYMVHRNPLRCKCHAYWIENDMYNDFTHAAMPTTPPCTLWFKGNLRTVDRETWEKLRNKNQ